MDEQLKLKKKFLMNSEKPTFVETFRKFCSSTTFHGLQFVGNKTIYLFERAFFAVAFITMCSVAYYFISVVYQKWSAAPVIVSISPEATYITDIPFPALTICNMNQAMAKAANNISKTSWENNILETLCNRKLNNGNKKFSRNKTTETSFQKFILQVSQPCQNMFLLCNYGSIDLNCSEVFKPVLTDEGLCCTFNSLDYSYLYSRIPEYLPQQPQSQAKPVSWSAETGYPAHLPNIFYPKKGAGTGERMGMTVILNAESDDYYCSSTNGAGFKYVIHSPTEAPLVKETGINIDVGVEARVDIKPTYETAHNHMKYLKKENRECVFEDEQKLYQFATYTRRNCEMECEADTIASNCNCALYYMPLIKDIVSTCNINDEKCTNGVSIQLATRNKGNQKCSKICKSNCYSLTFSSKTSSSEIKLTNFIVVDKILQSRNASYVYSSISRIDFLYTGNAFNPKLKQEYIDTTDFLTNVGGIISLFLGFSLISLTEVFYFLTLQPLCSDLRYYRELKQKYENSIKNGVQLHTDINYLSNNLFNIIKNSINNFLHKHKYPYQD